tara:strand:- start:399 stop:563 length:165 start_codon:yes stop_codon:yes gene_type:complete
MDKLFRWTIYLMIIFVIAVAIYIYSWLSFKPQKKTEIAGTYSMIVLNANTTNYD